MKSIILICLLLTSNTGRILAQDEHPCTEAEKPVKWKVNVDFYARPGPHTQNKQLIANYDPAKMKPHLQKSLEWIKKKMEGLTGYQAESQFIFIYGEPDPENLKENIWYLDTKVLGNYYLWVMTNAWYCYNRNGKPDSYFIDGPADISIYFNKTDYHAVPAQILLASAVNPYKIKGRWVYKLPEYKKTVGRVDAYEYPGPVPPTTASHSRIYFTNTYVIRNSDKPLFITVTRREFFEQYLADMPTQYATEVEWAKKSNVKSPEDIDEEWKARIAEIKKLTAQGAYGYSQSNLESRLKKADEFYAELKITEGNVIKDKLKLLEEDYQESVRLVKEYLKKSDDILNKSVNLDQATIHINPYAVKQIFEHLDERNWLRQTEMAFVNQDYFNPKLPPDVPQFICIEIINLDNLHPHLHQLIERINKDFDFAGLQVLLK